MTDILPIYFHFLRTFNVYDYILYVSMFPKIRAKCLEYVLSTVDNMLLIYLCGCEISVATANRAGGSFIKLLSVNLEKICKIFGIPK